MSTVTKIRNVNPVTRAAVLSRLFLKDQARFENFSARADESQKRMDEILAEVEADPVLKAKFDALNATMADVETEETAPVVAAAE